jgi:SAM-dependent methyltransferase
VEATGLVAHLDEQVFAPFLEPLTPIGTILEIGAGGGRFTEILATKAATVLAGDAAPTMLTLLAGRFRDRPGVRPLRLDGRTLAGVGDGAVDAVFSYDVFVHLAAWDTFNYLQEIRRVLRPGGRAIVHHGNALSELGWRKFAADAERERQGLPSAGRFPAMTPALMKAMVEHSGLGLVRSEEAIVRRDAIALIEKPA